MASRFPVPQQKSLLNQCLQSDLHSAVVAIQSLVNQNNSRYETLARERQAALANRSMYDQGGNRNSNSMNTAEMDLRPTDSDRNTETAEIPPTERRRSSVSFSQQPEGTNVKVYDPNAKLGNTNEKSPSEEPLRSNLKLTSESNAPLYNKPGGQIQLGDSTMNPALQRRPSSLQPSKERVASKMQLFDNPTKTLQPYEAGRLSGIDTWPAGYDQTTGQVKSYKDQVCKRKHRPFKKKNARLHASFPQHKSAASKR